MVNHTRSKRTKSKDLWVIDSGSGRHLTGREDVFVSRDQAQEAIEFIYPNGTTELSNTQGINSKNS